MKAKQHNTKESVLAVVLLLLLFFQFTKSKYFITASILLILLALLSAGFSKIIDTGWRKITHLLGIVSSTILFSVLFYGIFFPVGFILRSFRRSSYSSFKPGTVSTFEARNKTFVKADLEQPF